MRPLRVLSIDFDYFVDATIEERIELFPDGNDDLPPELNTYVWVTHYAEEIYNPRMSRLKSIGVREAELNQLKECIADWGCQAGAIAIQESHKYILGYIENLLNRTICDSVSILHIDHHTDCYDIGEELNCGNWLNCLDREIVRYDGGMEVTWVRNKDSDTEYSGAIRHRITDTCGNFDIYEDTKQFFRGEAPDFIFLCKSSPWTPPHLDDYFDQLAKVLVDCHCINGEIPANRNTAGFWQVVEQTKQQYAQVRSNLRLEE